MARHYCSTLLLPWSGLICNVFIFWGTEESKKDISKTEEEGYQDDESTRIESWAPC